MRIKRDKRDALFSKIVRHKANWTCEHCGKYHPEGERQSLHCSHLFSRRHKSTRWDEDNVFAHCFRCHQYLGENPVIFHDWAREYMGVEKFERVRMKALTVTKLSKSDLELIYLDLKKQAKELGL